MFIIKFLSSFERKKEKEKGKGMKRKNITTYKSYINNIS